jgi:hypothetical protein
MTTGVSESRTCAAVEICHCTSPAFPPRTTSIVERSEGQPGPYADLASVRATVRKPADLLLLFALVFDLGLWMYEAMPRRPIESTAIALILLFNAALGLFQEQRSEAALSRLKA